MANHGDGWLSSMFDFSASLFDRQLSQKRRGSMFGISTELDEKPPPRPRFLRLFERKPSHPREPDSASVKVPIKWDTTREFNLYPDCRGDPVKLPLTHLVQRPSRQMEAKIKRGELLDFLVGCKITPAVDIGHEWGLEGSILLYDPRDPPSSYIKYVYVTDHLREESETRRNVLADPKRNLFFLTLRRNDLPTYHFWQDVDKDGDPRGADRTIYVNERSSGRVRQQLDDEEVEIVAELHRARENSDDEEEEDVVQVLKSEDGELVNGIIDVLSGEDSTALDEPASGEQGKLIFKSTSNPTTTSDNELGLTEPFGSVYDSDEEFDSGEGSEWDENFRFDPDDEVNSDEYADSDEDYIPDDVVLHRSRSNHGSDPSAPYYYKCSPWLAEHQDRELTDLIEIWEDNLRVRGLAPTLENFNVYQPLGDEVLHFGGGLTPEKPPKRRWPPGTAVDTVAYKLAIASETVGPVPTLSGDEPWTRNDNVGFWNGNYKAMHHPLEDNNPDYHRRSTKAREMETKRHLMLQPSSNEGARDSPSMPDSIITSYDENGDPRDPDYDVVMTDALHRPRGQSELPDPGCREIRLYDGRPDRDGTNVLPNPSRDFRDWKWYGLTLHPKRRDEQIDEFWDFVEDLMHKEEDIVELKAYNDDGTEAEDGCRLMAMSMFPTTFENRMCEYLSDPARNAVYLVPKPDALETLQRNIEDGIGIPIFNWPVNGEDTGGLSTDEINATGNPHHRLRGSSGSNDSTVISSGAVPYNQHNSNKTVPPFIPTDCRYCGSYITSPTGYAAHHVEHFRGRTASPQEMHPEVQQALKRARFRSICPECGLDLTGLSTFNFAMHRRGHEQQRSARSTSHPSRPPGKRVAFEPKRGRGVSPRPKVAVTREEEQGLGGRLWQLLSGVYSASVGRARSASTPPPLTPDSPHVYRGYPRKLFPGPMPAPNSFDESYLKNARRIQPLPYARSPSPAHSSPRRRSTSLPPKSRSVDDLHARPPPETRPRSSASLDDDGSIPSLHHRKGGHHQDSNDRKAREVGGIANFIARCLGRDGPTSPLYPPPPSPPGLSPRTAALRARRPLQDEQPEAEPRPGGDRVPALEIEAARAAELRLRDDIDKLRWVHYLLPALQWGPVTQQHLADRRGEMRLEQARQMAGGDEGVLAEGWLVARAREMLNRERGIHARRVKEEGVDATGPFSDAELRFKWHERNFRRLKAFSNEVARRRARGESAGAEFPDWELAWYAERAKERKGPGEYGDEEGKEHHRWRLIHRREKMKKEWAMRHPGWDESQESEPYQEGAMPASRDFKISRKPVAEPPRLRQQPATVVRRKPVGEPPRRRQQSFSGPSPVRRKPVGSGIGPVLHRRRGSIGRYHPYAASPSSPVSTSVGRAHYRRVHFAPLRSRTREANDDALAEMQLLRESGIVPPKLSHAIAMGQPMAEIEDEWLPHIRSSANLSRFWSVLNSEMELYEQLRTESEEEKRQLRRQTPRTGGVPGDVADGSDSGIELVLMATQRKKASGSENPTTSPGPPPKPPRPPTVPPMLSTTSPKFPRSRSGMFRRPSASKCSQTPITEERLNNGDEATEQAVVETKTGQEKALKGKKATATTTSAPTTTPTVRKARHRRQSISDKLYRPVVESDNDSIEVVARPVLHEPDKLKKPIKERTMTPTPRKTKHRRTSFSNQTYKPTADEGDNDEDKELTQALFKELEQAEKLSKKRKHGSDMDGPYLPSKMARREREDSEEYVEQGRTKKSSEQSKKSKEPTGIKKTVTIEVASEPATKAATADFNRKAVTAGRRGDVNYGAAAGKVNEKAAKLAAMPASPTVKQSNIRSASKKTDAKKAQRVTGKKRSARSGSPSPDLERAKSIKGYSLRSRLF